MSFQYKGFLMKKSKYAFTMIEMIFVIVVLGILAAVAVPKMAATRTDAEITKGRADISSIRSAIITERQSRLIKGDSAYISGIALNTGGLFKGVLTYPIADNVGSGDWTSTGTDSNATATYNYQVGTTTIQFIYTRTPDGIFTCSLTAGDDDQDTLCADLIN